MAKSDNSCKNFGKYILWFNEISKKDLPKVGGKGANLGEMFKIMPVPNGFCVTADAYALFMEETSLQEEVMAMLQALDIKDSRMLDERSEKIREMIKKENIPDDMKKEIAASYKKLNAKFVAVRSSATAEDLPTASFAGQQDTYLNISGEKEVINAVKSCWASLFTSRAIYYRETNKFNHNDVKISVVVQEMVQSEKAGVMFTVNPVNNNRSEMIIEGSYGLGESVVSGKVTPDTYTIKKTPFSILSINIGSKSTAIIQGKDGKNIEIETSRQQQDVQLLNEKELKELASLGMKIEQHYNIPQDIEWGISKKKVYILQSRPITTLR